MSPRGGLAARAGGSIPPVTFAYDRRSMRERDRRIYKVTFLNQGQVYEIYAKKVAQGGLLGFVEIEGIVFGQRTTVVVDPSEERLKAEFEGVKRSYIPMHAVVRIDEVKKQGVSAIILKAEMTPRQVAELVKKQLAA